MTFGETYVEVNASVVNRGIAPMAMVSSNPEPGGGADLILVWIRWVYNDETGEGGYTGTGWYFSDPDNNIQNHFESEQAFKDYLVDVKPENLDEVLGDWSTEDKVAFLNRHLQELDAGGCLYFSANI